MRAQNPADDCPEESDFMAFEFSECNISGQDRHKRHCYFDNNYRAMHWPRMNQRIGYSGEQKSTDEGDCRQIDFEKIS